MAPYWARYSLSCILMICINHCKMVLYADDTALFSASSDYNVITSDIHSDLAHIYNWLISNKPSLNIDKTKSMLFGTSQRLARTGAFSVYRS